MGNNGGIWVILRSHLGLCPLIHLMLLVIAPHMKLHFPQNLILLSEHIASLLTATGWNLGCQLNLLGYNPRLHWKLSSALPRLPSTVSPSPLTHFGQRGHPSNTMVWQRQREENSHWVSQGLWKYCSWGDFAEWGVISSKKSKQITCLKLPNYH